MIVILKKINTVYKEKAISAELGVVIGAITESQRLINHALKSEEKKGGLMNMCGALEELVNEGVEKGVEKEKISLTKMMIEEGEPVNKIVKYTGLSVDKLNEIALSIGKTLIV